MPSRSASRMRLPFDHTRPIYGSKRRRMAEKWERRGNGEGRGWSIVAISSKGTFFPCLFWFLLTTAEFRRQRLLYPSSTTSPPTSAHDDGSQRDYNMASRLVLSSSPSFRSYEEGPFFSTGRGVLPSSPFSGMFYFLISFSFY